MCILLNKRTALKDTIESMYVQKLYETTLPPYIITICK